MKEYHAVVDKDGELLLCDSLREAQQVSRQLHDEQGPASSHRAVVLVERQDWMAVPDVIRNALNLLADIGDSFTQLDEEDRPLVSAWLAALPPVTTEVRDGE